jgi:putative transposase
MSQSLAKVLIHLVFSTKNRQPLIPAEIEPALHAYIAGTFEELQCTAILVGGTSDHIHALFALSKSAALKDVVQQVKQGSSVWMKDKGHRDFYWQSGYGAFSIGESGVAALKTYIRDQKKHHRKLSFQDELRALLRKYNIPFDERYLWD